MDSEHNALAQALEAGRPEEVARLTITASGGPFRTWSAERMAAATPAEASAHPTYAMGAKINIDSATLMNKGLELIEAHHLFGMEPDEIDAVVHPQSIVHGLVTWRDGGVTAVLGHPDMRVPISHCLGEGRRLPLTSRPLDLAAVGSLTFEPIDAARFPCFALAGAALREGGAAPTVLNAANEVAVSAFLGGRHRLRRHRARGGADLRGVTRGTRRLPSRKRSASTATRGAGQSARCCISRGAATT